MRNAQPRYGPLARTYCFPIKDLILFILVNSRRCMAEKVDVWQGTLALMVLKTLETLGPLHGYGIARRIEQTSGDLLAVRYGTLYPALLKLEQEGYISAEWGVSDNNRRAKYYVLTRAGKRHLEREARTGIGPLLSSPDSFLHLRRRHESHSCLLLPAVWLLCHGPRGA